MSESPLAQIAEEGDVVTTDEAENVEANEAPLPVPTVIVEEVQEIQKIMKSYALPLAPKDAPDIPLRDALTAFPESYTSNSEREKLVHAFVSSFDRQFRDLYRQRKPLLLLRPNECNVPKFVCSTIRPTQLPFKALYDYDAIAAFVSEYLSYEFLPVPSDLPPSISSPTTTLWTQKGHCFDYSILLCSLLQGVGYDAYVVCGYATREVCLMDRSRHECPDLKETPNQASSASVANTNKYALKPAKKLESRFLAAQEGKKLEEKKAQERKEEEAAAKALEEKLKPENDEMYGLRVHSWVLVLRGSREVPENFFIEPTTGQALSCYDKEYLGIESVFNSTNVWVNMTQCINGIQDIVYDLGDSTKWEYIFPNVSIPVTGPKAIKVEEELPVLDAGSSWVDKISLTPQQFETKCPLGKRTILSKFARTDIYSDYLRDDGLVKRVTVTSDLELRNVTKVIETFAHRKDKLLRRISTPLSDGSLEKLEEYFEPGRSHGVRQHILQVEEDGRKLRTLLFYNIREDGLVKRTDDGEMMVEEFKDRPDFLTKRLTSFRPGDAPPIEKIFNLTKKSVHRRSSIALKDPSKYSRNIAFTVESFARNSAIPAFENVAERTFADEIISVVYHKDERHVTASTRVFEKPQLNAKRTYAPITGEMVETYSVDSFVAGAKNFQLHKMFSDLQAAEAACLNLVRSSEAETQEILDRFGSENTSVQLDISFYDTTRNLETKKRREALEQKIKEEEILREKLEQDYLAPFLAQLDDPVHLTAQDALLLKDRCLKDLKDRLIDKANLIQEWFEKEETSLQQKQAWFQQNQGNLSPEEEQDYVNYCTDAIFRIKILEQRLEQHKELAPQKYVKLDHTIRTDKRLAHLL